MGKLAINGGEALHTTGWPGWPPKDPGYLQKLTQVIESGVWGGAGAMNVALVEEFKKVCDCQYVVPNTSGTTALEICLRALGVGAGDEVIVPPYTFIATASAVVAANAVPIFADIHPDTLCLNAEAVEAAITPRTKAVTAVHIGGMPADLGALQAVCDKHGLALLEDCAQAHGAVYKGRKVGAIGDMGSFSFQSSKNITAGEGGICTTDSEELWLKSWSYANVGRVPGGEWYDHRVMGMNYRMTEFQAALILRGIETFETQMAIRDENTAHLRARLSEIDGIDAQAFSSGAERCAYHLFIFRYDRAGFGGLPRDKFIEALSAEGVPAFRGYNPLYSEGMFAEGRPGAVDYGKASCPVTDHVCTDGSFWTSHSVLLGSRQDMDDIADAILKIQANVGELKE